MRSSKERERGGGGRREWPWGIITTDHTNVIVSLEAAIRSEGRLCVGVGVSGSRL